MKRSIQVIINDDFSLSISSTEYDRHKSSTLHDDNTFNDAKSSALSVCNAFAEAKAQKYSTSIDRQMRCARFTAADPLIFISIKCLNEFALGGIVVNRYIQLTIPNENLRKVFENNNIINAGGYVIKNEFNFTSAGFDALLLYVESTFKRYLLKLSAECTIIHNGKVIHSQ